MSLTVCPPKILSYIDAYLKFPSVQQDPFKFIENAKEALNLLALEKFHRDVVTYGDVITEKCIENAVVLFVSGAVAT